MDEQVKLKLTDELFKQHIHSTTDKILGNGCYSRCYALKHSNAWVIKHGGDDGTRTYLEWVLLRSRQGRRMRGMPVVDFVWSAGDGRYIAGMKRYAKPEYDEGMERIPRISGWGGMAPSYIKELVKAFKHETGVEPNDLHGGNFLYDRKLKTYILTDPSSDTYLPLGSPVSKWSDAKAGYEVINDPAQFNLTHSA